MKLITINTCRESGNVIFRKMRVPSTKISALDDKFILIDGIWFELTDGAQAVDRIQQLVLENHI